MLKFQLAREKEQSLQEKVSTTPIQKKLPPLPQDFRKKMQKALEIQLKQ